VNTVAEVKRSEPTPASRPPAASPFAV